MGLDTVELLFAIEDAFQIRIGDDEAANLVTVGDIQRLILSKRQLLSNSRPLKPGGCLTSAAFYETRRGLIHASGRDRRQIRPSTRLADVLPLLGRRKRWRNFQKSVKFKIPELEYSWAIVLAILIGSVVVTVSPAIQSRAGTEFVLLALFASFFVMGLLLRVSSPLARAFPNQSVTVGDLARDLAAANHALLAGEAMSSEKEVWDALRRVIVGQTGVAPELVTPEARLAEDLRID